MRACFLINAKQRVGWQSAITLLFKLHLKKFRKNVASHKQRALSSSSSVFCFFFRSPSSSFVRQRPGHSFLENSTKRQFASGKWLISANVESTISWTFFTAGCVIFTDIIYIFEEGFNVFFFFPFRIRHRWLRTREDDSQWPIYLRRCGRRPEAHTPSEFVHTRGPSVGID